MGLLYIIIFALSRSFLGYHQSKDGNALVLAALHRLYFNCMLLGLVSKNDLLGLTVISPASAEITGKPSLCLAVNKHLICAAFAVCGLKIKYTEISALNFKCETSSALGFPVVMELIVDSFINNLKSIGC